MNIYNWQSQDRYKSICKYLHNREIISNKDWVIDSNHFNREISETVYAGYTVWSKPVLALIKKSKTFEKIASKPAQWLIEDIKFKKGINKKPHIRGYLFRNILFTPISWSLGNLKLLGVTQKNKQVVAANKR
ncbi:MAG: hypothetical protein ACTJHW_11390 [Paenalcaligenes sp.]